MIRGPYINSDLAARFSQHPSVSPYLCPPGWHTEPLPRARLPSPASLPYCNPFGLLWPFGPLAAAPGSLPCLPAPHMAHLSQLVMPALDIQVPLSMLFLRAPVNLSTTPTVISSLYCFSSLSGNLSLNSHYVRPYMKLTNTVFSYYPTYT